MILNERVLNLSLENILCVVFRLLFFEEKMSDDSIVHANWFLGVLGEIYNFHRLCTLLQTVLWRWAALGWLYDHCAFGTAASLWCFGFLLPFTESTKAWWQRWGHQECGMLKTLVLYSFAMTCLKKLELFAWSCMVSVTITVSSGVKAQDYAVEHLLIALYVRVGILLSQPLPFIMTWVFLHLMKQMVPSRCTYVPLEQG